MNAQKAYNGVEPDHGELLRQIKEVMPLILRLQNPAYFTYLFNALNGRTLNYTGQAQSQADWARKIRAYAEEHGLHISLWEGMRPKKPNERLRQFIFDNRHFVGGYFVREGKNKWRWTIDKNLQPSVEEI